MVGVQPIFIRELAMFYRRNRQLMWELDQADRRLLAEHLENRHPASTELVAWLLSVTRFAYAKPAPLLSAA